MDNVNLLSGFDPVYLIFSFLTLLAAAIFVAIAYTLPSKGSSGLVWVAMCAFGAKMCSPVRRACKLASWVELAVMLRPRAKELSNC